VAALEELKVGARVEGIGSNGAVIIVQVRWHGPNTVTVSFRDEATGQPGERLLFRSEERRLRVLEEGRPWAFDADGELFQLAAEANRLRLAYLFDPQLAVHISAVTPLPHQIAAVYEEMLPRQPLRFLLADDPGAGKTIMAGLLIQELRLRGDVERCLIVAPANLGEQWLEEMDDKFDLPFRLIGRQEIETARTGNPFAESDLVISRIDLLKQDDIKPLLEGAPDWDLVIVDEAHKMSASVVGDEVKKTARYQLGELLGRKTRHYLLLTATPHRGKPEDFELFLALLDEDRFAGTVRQGTRANPQDVMRRMLKEELVDFDGRPLFPERRAYTVNYELSDDEVLLYEEVTNYVREQMNRAERMAESDDPNTRRRGSILGFALTGLQRRLASSPAAIHESLARRLRLRKQALAQKLQSGRAERLSPIEVRLRQLDETDLSELPEEEQDEIVAAAGADQEIQDLQEEIRALEQLVRFAEKVRKSGVDKKWEKLREVLERPEMFDPQGKRRKLVIFTEHRDTLDYLVERIGQLLGGPDRVVAIQGGMLRERRREAQARFVADPEVLVLVATDAAGEGINLQRAHLMVNYDLPWNPNRLEQRFGRIHRFGQRETCHVWNLVAYQTREGAVFQRLFEKLEEERKALGGKVFDVLGELFTEVSLRELMLEAIRATSAEAAREVAAREVDPVFTRRLHQAIEERALDAVTLEADRLRRLRDQKERAEALRLIPHVVESYFVPAFTYLGGAIQRREPHRYHISNVPAPIRQRDRQIGRGYPVQRTYDRICFDRNLVDYPGKPPAVFVAPGHPLFEAVTDLVLEQCRDLLRRGTILVDDDNDPPVPRVLFGIESAIVDGTLTPAGHPHELSRRVGYLAVGADGTIFPEGMAPHLEYRALREDESEAARRILEGFQLGRSLEDAAAEYGIAHVVAPHLEEVRSRRLELLDRMAAAVRQRLTAEIVYWDGRYADLRQQEAAGKRTRLSSEMALRRRDELEERLERRQREIDQQRNIGALPPIVHAAAFVIPAALLAGPEARPEAETELRDRRRIEAIAMEYVMARERAAGRMPADVSDQHLGWDIESREPDGTLRFIEVKGRRRDAEVVQLSRNERFAARNKGSQYYLAVVLVDGETVAGYYEQADPLADERDDLIAGVSLDISRMRAGAVELPQ